MADEGEEVVPSATAVDRGPDRAADRAVDVVFALVLVATMAVWFRLTRNTWFFLDEWALAGRGRSLGDFLEPYNGHLSVTYLAVYRAHMELFGFGSYTLLRVLGLVALASGPVLLYLTTRRALGPMAAAIAAIAVLWAEGVSLEPGAMNHSAVVACSVVAAWAARSTGRRADRWLLGALTLGFLTAGGMVATAAALVVGAALTRAGPRRWLAILVPAGLWAAWYVVQDRPPIPEEHRIDVGDALRLVVDGFAATLRGVAGGSALGGALLLVVLVAVAARQVRVHGRPAVVSLVSWNVASVVWWLGLAQSRQGLADPETYRYRLLCSVFIVLSLVPAVPSPVRFGALGRGARWSVAVPAAAVAGVAAVLALANIDAARDAAQTLEAHGGSARRLWLVVSSEPPVVDLGDEEIAGLGNQVQAHLVTLRDLYGPPGLDAAAVDQAVVDAGAIQVGLARAPDDGRCTPVDVLELETDDVVVRAGPEPVELLVRRYGEVPVLVTTLPAGSTRVVRTSPLVGDLPWVLHFEGAGACAFGV
jgi:hypothetical protein